MSTETILTILRQEKDVAIEGMVPALIEGAAEIANSTRDLYTMLKTIMENDGGSKEQEREHFREDG